MGSSSELASDFMVSGVLKALLADDAAERGEARKLLCECLLKFCGPEIFPRTKNASPFNLVAACKDDLLAIEKNHIWRIVDEECSHLLRNLKLLAKATKEKSNGH